MFDRLSEDQRQALNIVRKGHIRAIYTRKNKTRLIFPRINGPNMALIWPYYCRTRAVSCINGTVRVLFLKDASYLRRFLCKTCLIFPRINGPNIFITGQGGMARKNNCLLSSIFSAG